MAFTDRYVTQAASGGDGTIGSPWTLAEGLDQAVAGDRVNIKSDAGYSLGADAVTNAGTAASAIVFRGYNSTIGDLEGQGRNADGTLNTTNFPVITLSGTLTLNMYVILEALKFTGSVNGSLVGDSGPDVTFAIQCDILNTANNASAIAFQSDNSSSLINSDAECSGAAHGPVVDGDNSFHVLGCRVKSNAGVHVALNFGVVVDTVMFGATTSPGVEIRNATSRTLLYGNTLPNVGTAFSTPADVPIHPITYINNHVTDCTKFIDNTYSGTADEFAIEVNNRVRDNTTPRTGIGDGVVIQEIATDTGGDETDFVDAGSDNFRLISAAPGKAAGMVAYDDCGALQRQEAGGGGGISTIIGG